MDGDGLLEVLGKSSIFKDDLTYCIALYEINGVKYIYALFSLPDRPYIQQWFDEDMDFLPDIMEKKIGTNPQLFDTDNDTLPDGWEYMNLLDPLDPTDAASDTDNDGLTNIEEYQHGTEPNNPDTDGDGVPDSYDTNPLGNASVSVRILNASIEVTYGEPRTVLWIFYCIDTDQIYAIDVSPNDIIPSHDIMFDIPDDLSNARIIVFVWFFVLIKIHFPPISIILPVEVDISEYQSRQLNISINMMYGYRFRDFWGNDWTAFTYETPINDPSIKVPATIIDKNGYGFSSGYDDNLNETSTFQGKVWFETILNDSDGEYWKLAKSTSGNISYKLIKQSDGLPFWLEAHYTNTSPGTNDTDHDGVSDAWEDSDGDGAFNIQELMIGKNSANPHDVLGIHLKIYVEQNIRNDMEYIKQAFLLSSRFIFDYTDGHAFISLIEFVDCIDLANTIVADFGPTGWAGRSCLAYVNNYWWGCYWFQLGDIKLNYYYLEESIYAFAFVIGHEVGHYVFGFFDEYCDINGNNYSSEVHKELAERGVWTVMGMALWSLPTLEDEINRELSTLYDYEILEQVAEKYGVNPITAQLGVKDAPCWYTILYDLYYMCGLIFYLGRDAYMGPHDKILYYAPLLGPFTIVEFYVRIV